jgi:hypothetical protein
MQSGEIRLVVRSYLSYKIKEKKELNMFTNWLANKTELITHPAMVWGLRILILVVCLLVSAFLNTGVALAEPGWGGVGG